MIPFIDIASYQEGSGIDWAAVAKFLLAKNPDSGIIVKVSEGTTYVNEYLRQQRQGAHAAGLKNVGLYHYGRPSKNSGHAEADFFIASYGNEHGLDNGEFLCLDIEDTDVPAGADLDAYVLDFAGRVGRAVGFPIIVYSGSWYTNPHNLNRDPNLAQLGLWWASVGDSLPSTPEPWASAGKPILLWQYDWHGSIPGIAGEVDLDYLVGGIETLRPFQWGNQPDPLAGGVTDVPLDVDVPANSESLDDMKKVAAVMEDHAQAIRVAPVGANVSDLARKIKSEADWLVRASWGH